MKKNKKKEGKEKQLLWLNTSAVKKDIFCAVNLVAIKQMFS